MSENHTRIPIVLVGFGDAASGFARVVHSIAEHLRQHYEIHHLAINVRDRVSGSYPWALYPSDLKGDFFGELKLQRLIESVRPRLVWILNDFWFLARYYPLLRGQEFKSVGYMPLDGRIVQPQLLGALQFYDEVVTYNEFSRQELASHFKWVANEDPEFSAPRLSVIPHGVDQERFRPLDGANPMNGDEQARRRRAREALHGPDCPFRDGFVVLNANQNAARKRYDLTLEGFARFAHGKPADVMLHLHCSQNSKGPLDGGVNIRELSTQLGIAERVIMTEPPISDEQLNLTYNACDVGLNTSWGEGWGLVSFEHAATRAAQVVPDHTACTDLWRGAAEFLDADASRDCDWRCCSTAASCRRSSLAFSVCVTRGVAAVVLELTEEASMPGWSPGREYRMTHEGLFTLGRTIENISI